MKEPQADNLVFMRDARLLPNGDLIAGYDFNGVASFTCSWDDQVCE